MPALDRAEAKRQLDASLGITTYVAPATPMKVGLTTTIGTDTTAGTAVIGGSYSDQNLGPAAAVVGSPTTASNAATISFTGMPDTTSNSVKAVEIKDNAGRRWGYGALTTARTTASGDTLSFAASALVFSQQ